MMLLQPTDAVYTVCKLACMCVMYLREHVEPAHYELGWI